MSANLTIFTNLLGRELQTIAVVFSQMEWAEDEIGKATKRHPDSGDTLYHSFKLLVPTASQMRTEFVYRGHCRELLDRVAEGEDTRLGTGAEIVIALCEVALATPINAAAAGLAFRMWYMAFPDQPEIDINRWHREMLDGASIDDAEGVARAKLAKPVRDLGTIECSGTHHGERVNCIYSSPHIPNESEGIPPAADSSDGDATKNDQRGT